MSLKHADDYYVVGTDTNHLGRVLYPPTPADRTYALKPSTSPGELVSGIADIVSQQSIDVLIATGVAVIRDFAAEGNPTDAALLIPSLAAVQACDSKLTVLQALDGVVPVPETVVIGDHESLDAAAEKLGLPYWLRDPEGQAAYSAFKVEHPKDAALWLELKRGWGHFTASRFLPGSNLAIHLLFGRNGHLVASSVHERIRYLESQTAPSGVTGVAAVSATRHRNDALEIGEKAVRALCASCGVRPTGLFCVDSKGDEDDVPHVTEINARPTNTWLLTRAGINFADLLARLSLGQDVAPVTPFAYKKDKLFLRKVDFEPCMVDPDHLLEPI
jgi:glutathione synthase/RimK-type ligase-like ATP-grasp enzyme